MKLSGKKDDELRKVIKERIAEKKRRELEIKTKTDTLRKLKNSYYQFGDAVREAKETLGGRKGETCPALKKAKTRYGGVQVVCKAKRYKYHCWSKEEMYRQHCFACHLTPEQAKTGMLYDRILIGRREDGQ